MLAGVKTMKVILRDSRNQKRNRVVSVLSLRLAVFTFDPIQGYFLVKGCMRTMNESEIKTCPEKPCKFCTGNSAVRKPDNTLMTSWEWCQSVNACGASIDWEKVFNHEDK